MEKKKIEKIKNTKPIEDEFVVLFNQLKQHKKIPSGDVVISERTRKLMISDISKKAKKVGEEAVEVAIEAAQGNVKTTIEESVDLIYNLFALWIDMEIDMNDIKKECKRRRLNYGIASKLPKK
jgi:phosphoribosyl-ATP pyrophosphohydrolase